MALFGVLALIALLASAWLAFLNQQLRDEIERRKQLEPRLEEESLILNAIMDSAVDYMFVKDRSSHFLRINASYQKLMGDMPAADILGKWDFELFPEKLAQHFYDEEQLIMKTGKPVFHLDRQTGVGRNKQFVSETKIPLFRKDGECIGIVGLGRDITPRILLEEELRRAKEEAESADKAKSEFLAVMSHEIRTPLNSLLGCAEMLDLTAHSEKQQRLIDIINGSGNILLSLINDILDFSKLEAGKLELSSTRFELAGFVEEALDMFRLQATSKGLSLTASIDGACPKTIITDRERLRQIIVNLLSNAVKFTERGYIRVGVRITDSLPEGMLAADTEPSGGDGKSEDTAPDSQQSPAEMAYFIPQEENPEYIVFEVKDTGIGIDQDQVGQLFQPFTQADPSTTRKFGGTGLGLALCRKLCHVLGGGITLASQPGKGSAFQAAIRLNRAAFEAGMRLEQDRVFIAEQEPEIEAFGQRYPLKILVADDILDNRHLIETMLSKLGLELHAVASGKDALQALSTQSHSFDILLLDLKMPQMDGFEVVTTIRQQEGKQANAPGAPLYIIALTADVVGSTRQECFLAGMDDYLTKPLKIAELQTALKHAWHKLNPAEGT